MPSFRVKSVAASGAGSSHTGSRTFSHGLLRLLDPREPGVSGEPGVCGVRWPRCERLLRLLALPLALLRWEASPEWLEPRDAATAEWYDSCCGCALAAQLRDERRPRCECSRCECSLRCECSRCESLLLLRCDGSGAPRCDSFAPRCDSLPWLGLPPFAPPPPPPPPASRLLAPLRGPRLVDRLDAPLLSEEKRRLLLPDRRLSRDDEVSRDECRQSRLVRPVPGV